MQKKVSVYVFFMFYAIVILLICLNRSYGQRYQFIELSNDKKVQAFGIVDSSGNQIIFPQNTDTLNITITSVSTTGNAVSSSNIGVVDDTYQAIGSEINTTGKSLITFYCNLTINNSSGCYLKILSDYEANADYELLIESDYVADISPNDTNRKVAIPFDCSGINFVKLYSKATDVDDGGGTIATIIINYTLE